MVTRNTLYSDKKQKNDKKCPFCHKNTPISVENNIYYDIIYCNVCKNSWVEGESAKRAKKT